MILFKVASYHQFISALVIKNQLLPNEEADIFLSNIVDFTGIAEKLKTMQIFRRVEILDDVGANEIYFSKTPSERKQFSKKVPNLWNINIDTTYTDYYFGHNIICNKLFYYFLLTRQSPPAAYSVQEGTASYHVDMVKNGDGDGLYHSYYKSKSLLKNLKGQYLFWPEATPNNWCTNILSIPHADENSRNIIRQLCEDYELPKEKYIFMSQCLEMMGLYSNEIDLVEMLASFVGKENIVIKLHPKSTVDKYTYRGYKVMDKDCGPWEFYSLLPELTEKVMVSPFSTSLLLPAMLYDTKAYAVVLHNMFIGETKPFFDFKSQQHFWNTSMPIVNAEHQILFAPSNAQNYKESILYIERKLKNDK